MSEISKGALTSENNNSFPNNNTGYITPTILRTFNQNMIDSLVDEISYTAESASFNSRINDLDPSGSQQSFASLEAATASLNAYTASQNIRNTSYSSSISALQTWSSSLDATYATDAQLTSLSASIAVTDLAQSASISQLLGFSSSLDATYATDAQLSASVSALSASVAVTDLQQSSSIAALQQFSSSLDATFATDAQLNAATASLVLQINTKLNTASYQTDSASFDTKINSLISATGSYAISSSVSTALDGKTDKTQFNSYTASASTAVSGAINSATQSLSSSIAVTTNNLDLEVNGKLDSSSFNSYTSSNDGKVNSLIAATGSYVTEAESGSFLITASFNNSSRDLTFTKGNGSQFAVNIPDVSGSAGDFVTTASFNSYTSSNDSRVNSLIAATASYVSISANNTFTGQTTFNNVVRVRNNETLFVSNISENGIGGGAAGIHIDSANGLAITSSVSINGRTVVTGSVTASQGFRGDLVGTASFATTASFALNATSVDTSSLVTTASFNSYTSSNDSRVNSLINKTGSFATTGSNIFNGNQSITGSVSLTGTITATSASFQYVQTVFETASVIYSSGSNQFGDASNDVQTLFGQVDVKNNLASTGSISASAGFFGNLNGTASFATTASLALTASYVETSSFALTASEARNVVLIARNGNTSTLGAGTIVHITGASGDNPIFNTASFNSEALSSNTLGVLRTPALSGADVEVLVSGIVTGVNTDPALGYVAGDIIYLSSSGQFTRVQPQAPNNIVTIGQVLRAQQNNGSIYVSINNGWELDELHNVAINGVADSDLLVYRSASGLWTNSSSLELGLVNSSSFNSYTASASTAVTASINVATQSLSASIAVTTNNLDLEVNGKLDSSSFNSYTASNDSKVNSLINATSSYVTESETGSFATTGSNTFTGQQNLQNALIIEEVGNPLEYTQLLQDALSNQLVISQAGASGYNFIGDVSASAFFGTASYATKALTASFALNAVSTDTGSLLTTASISGDTITFTKGNGTTFPIVVPTASGSVPSGTVSSSAQITAFGFATTGSNVFQGNQQIFGNVTASGEGYFAGRFEVGGNGVFNGGITGSLLGSASFAVNAGLLDGKDSTEFATTSSNIFTGIQYVSASVYVRNGDIFNISNNTTLNPDLYLTESQAGQVNIIKGWGDNPASAGPGSSQSNYTGSLRITGSNNTVAIPQIRATGVGAGADSQGYISGSDNIIAGNFAGIYLNTGSQLFPKTQNNQLSQNSYISMNFTTSSLSGGHPTISNGIINNSGFTINHNSGSVSAASNILNGAFLTSTQNFVTNTRPSISTNIGTGQTVTLNHISSSINYQGNIFNSGVTINNHLSSSGLSTNNFNFTNNVVFGGSSGTGLGVWVSGSQSSNIARLFSDSLIGGRNIIVSSSFVSSSNANLISSLVVGNGLTVSASHSTGTNGGSTFLGRFNDTGSLALAQDIVFAVGTGTSTSARRTGMWIDSGSNAVISGSFRTIGNVAFTGSVDVTGSQVTLQNAGAIALAVRSGSVEVTSPQGTGYFYTNLPLTSSAARINGTALVSDLIVSGVFAGNSSLQVLGNASVTGSTTLSNLTVSGSTVMTGSIVGNVTSLSVTSNTASLNLNNGNFFTLQLISGSDVRIEPSNIKAGQTISLRLNTTGSGTVSFPSSVKQASGSAYVPTTGTGIDVITFVSFDSTDLYISNLKNFN